MSRASDIVEYLSLKHWVRYLWVTIKKTLSKVSDQVIAKPIITVLYLQIILFVGSR